MRARFVLSLFSLNECVKAVYDEFQNILAKKLIYLAILLSIQE